MPIAVRIDYHCAAMSSGTEYRRALVAAQFHRARRRAALESLLSRFSGQTADLLSFGEVVDKLGMSGQSSLGVHQIPIDAIVGSVGRYQDFTRTFLPRHESDEDRWVRVGAAAPTVADLPPIEVYKIGDAYFVLDGNHRVSIARQQNLSFIDAAVTEVRTRAPLPAGAGPDDLIIAAEHAAFLTYTRLDTLRPGADFRVSVPGQHRHLENHIEAYRFALETVEGRDLPYDEAAARWYDEAYLPLVQAIREQGILRYFPGRTETDFFVWLSRHRAELQSELGLPITPDVTVSRLLARARQSAAGERLSLTDRLRRLVGLTPPEPIPPRTWAQERTLDRYSSHLVAGVLLPVAFGVASGRAVPDRESLTAGLALAEEEGAQFCVLFILDHPEPTPDEVAAIASLRDELATRSISPGVVVESGDAVQRTLEMAFVNDLIVLDRTFGASGSDDHTPTAAARAIIDAANRPIWIPATDGRSPIPRRILLVHDTRRRFDEAIFIAAYMAERWRAELAILPLSNGRNTADVVTSVGEYLALHEVYPTFLESERPTAAATGSILAAARRGEHDLIIATGPNRGRKGNKQHQVTDDICTILHDWPRSLLIAT